MAVIKFIAFLYFFTLHADQLHISVYLWNVRLNNIVALLLFVALLFVRRGYLPKFDQKITFGFLAIIASLFISTLISAHLERSIGYFLLAIYTFIFYFYMVYVLSLVMGFSSLFKIYMYSFFVVGIYASMQLILSIFGMYDPFANQKLGFMVRPNAFAYEPSFYALFMVPVVFYYNNLYIVYKARGVGFRALLLNLFFLLSTSTGTVFSYIIYTTISFFRLRRLLPYMVLVLGLILLSYPFFTNIYDMFFFKFFRWDFYNHWSFRERWGQIENSYFVFKDNPIFGVGLGGVGMYIFQRYTQGEDYYLRASETLITFKSFDPMNVTTEVLASQGVFGAVCYLIFLLFLFGKAKYAIKRAQFDEEKVMIKSLLVATVLMLVVLQFNQGIFRTYIWVQMAVLYSASMHVLSGRRLSLW